MIDYSWLTWDRFMQFVIFVFLVVTYWRKVTIYKRNHNADAILLRKVESLLIDVYKLVKTGQEVQTNAIKIQTSSREAIHDIRDYLHTLNMSMKARTLVPDTPPNVEKT